MELEKTMRMLGRESSHSSVDPPPKKTPLTLVNKNTEIINKKR